MAETDMEERVARALHRARGFTQTWDEMDRFERNTWIHYARAAIEAMREPTDSMIEAGVRADFGNTLGSRAEYCHRAMIDAALTPPSKD